MHVLLHTELTAFLARAGVGQAAFARLSGVTARQVNNWARGKAVAPAWAALLALAPEELSPDLFATLAEDTDFSWHEVLGVSETADAATVRRAWTGLTLLYHPDKGGRPEQMVRVNAAYERAQGMGSGQNAHRR